MKAQKVQSLGVESIPSVPSVEGSGDSQMRDSSLLQAFNVVCKVTKREIQHCFRSAQNDKRQWSRKDVRSFSQRLKIRTATNGVMSVRCSEWSHIPAHYLYPDIYSTGSDPLGCGDEDWLRTPGGSTLSAVRKDGSRATVVLVPLTSNKCLPPEMARGLSSTEEYISGDDLKNMILNHLEVGNSCLQIFTTNGRIQPSSSTTACGSQATVVSNDSGSQASVNTTSCESQATVNSNDCGSQATVRTTSCGCQATMDTTTSGTQAAPTTIEAECQVAPAMVDVACQTDPVQTSDAESSATEDMLSTSVHTRNLGLISPTKAQVELNKHQSLSTPVKASPQLPGNKSLKTQDMKNYHHETPSSSKDHLSESQATVFTEATRHVPECRTPSCQDYGNAFVSCKQENFIYIEDDFEEMDAFEITEGARQNAMTEELYGRFGLRNEMSLADELSVASSNTSVSDETNLPRVGYEYQEDIEQTIVQKGNCVIPFDLLDVRHYSYKLSSNIDSFCEARSCPPSCESSIYNELALAKVNRLINKHASVTRNVIGLADEINRTMYETPQNKELTTSLTSISCTKTSLPRSTITSSDLSDMNAMESNGNLCDVKTGSLEITVSQSFSNSGSHSNALTDDVMLRVFGFDPTKSPFVVNGYSLLPSMGQTLDDIHLPVIEKKEIEFMRTDDGMFVSVGRGSYGCVYLAKMAERRGQVVVKDYINQFVTWEVIQHEAQLLQYLSDTGFVPEFVGLLKSSASYAGHSLVQEYFGKGLTIFKLLTSNDYISKTAWIRICCKLADGLEAIHSKHVLLNDIKGDTVLVDMTLGLPEVRYIDVGMATYRQGLRFEQSQPHIDVYEHLAPEVCMGSHSSPLSDIYSLGQLLGHIGRKSQIPELMSVSDACTHPLPIDRMSVATLRTQLGDLLKAMEEEEAAEVNRIMESPDGSNFSE